MSMRAETWGTIVSGPLTDPQRWLDLVAGFAGSVIVLFVRRDASKWEALGIVIVGVIVAYFGTSYLAGFLPSGDGVRGVAGLILGMLAFAVSGRALGYARRGKLPVIGREGRDEP